MEFLWVSKWVQDLLQTPHFGCEYASCILAEGPYVYSSRRPLTLCGPVVHLMSRGRRPHRRLVMQMAKSKKTFPGLGLASLCVSLSLPVYVYVPVCVRLCDKIGKASCGGARLSS